MLENIQITNKNGDNIMVEPICYLQVKSTGKKYLLYTLNEKVDNDLTKIYVAQVADGVEAQPIEQNEWDNLRKAMSKMSKREPVEDVEYLSLNGTNFSIGEAKKLGIPILLKQVFKDEAAAKTIANVQNNNTPVGMFIDPNLVAEPVQEQPADMNSQNIFTNPLKPVVESNEQVMSQNIQSNENQTVPVLPTVENVANDQSAMMNPPDNNETPVQEQPVVEVPAMPVTMEQSPIITNSPELVNIAPIQNVIPAQVNQPINEIQSEEEKIVTDNVAPISNLQQNVVVPTENVESSGAVVNMVSDEEALRAIELLQKYIDQESQRIGV